MPYKSLRMSEVWFGMHCQETEDLPKKRGVDAISILEERVTILEYSICLVSKKVEEIERRFP